MTTEPHRDAPRTRWTSGTTVPGDGWVYVTPGAREIINHTALVPGWRRIASQGPDEDGDFALFGGENASKYQFVRATDCDVSTEGEAPTTVTITTHVTIPRQATAEQVANALAHVDGHHEVTVHTYADRIEIHAHHEETRG